MTSFDESTAGRGNSLTRCSELAKDDCGQEDYFRIAGDRLKTKFLPSIHRRDNRRVDMIWWELLVGFGVLFLIAAMVLLLNPPEKWVKRAFRINKK